MHYSHTIMMCSHIYGNVHISDYYYFITFMKSKPIPMRCTIKYVTLPNIKKRGKNSKNKNLKCL